MKKAYIFAAVTAGVILLMSLPRIWGGITKAKVAVHELKNAPPPKVEQPFTPPAFEGFDVTSSTVPVIINNYHRALMEQYGLRVEPGKSVRMWLIDGSFNTAFGATGNPVVSGTPPSGPPTPTVSDEAQEMSDGFKFLLLEGSTEKVHVQLRYKR